MRAFVGALLAFILLNAASPAHAYDDVPMRQIDFGGGHRLFGLYVPSTYSAGRPAPLIIALHGRFSSAKALHAQSGLQAVAEARGAILVYPETAGRFWNDGGHAMLPYRSEQPSDDIGFLNALVDALAHDYDIDRARIYAVGHDQGGSMAYRLACSSGVPLAGVAVVNGPMWDFTRIACASVRPARMLIVQGRRNQYLPYEGDPRAEAEPLRLSAADTLAFWRSAYGCGQQTRRGRGISALYATCASGASLAFVSVERGSNDWFRVGASRALNRHNVDAATLLDQFFFQGAAALTFPAERSSADARSSFVYVPPTYDAARPTPVVVLLHGRPGTALGMAVITEMNSVADRHGFIVVYPDGVNNEWNSTADLMEGSNRNNRDAPISRVDDVAFLRQLARELGVDFNVDSRRIYLSGFSNGAIMTARMACSGADTFAAFAIVGGAFYNPFRQACQGEPPRPVLFMHGTADTSVPFDGVFLPLGDQSAPRRIAPPVPESVEYWVTRNGCGANGVRSEFPERGQSPGTHVSRLVLAEHCTDNATVSFYVITAGGHNWPGVPNLVGASFAGTTNMDINAGEEIWSFFEQHTLGAQR